MPPPFVCFLLTGPQQFLTADASFPIPVPELEESRQGPGKWAKINTVVLQELMRTIVDNPALAKAVGLRAREHIVANFEQNVVMEQVLARLSIACERIRRRRRSRKSTNKPVRRPRQW